MEDYQKCMNIIEKWGNTPPVSLQKSNTAAQDMKAAALETLSITALLVLVWIAVTVALYF